MCTAACNAINEIIREVDRLEYVVLHLSGRPVG